MASKSKTVEKGPSVQEVVQIFNNKKTEMTTLSQKITELNVEKDEYGLVLETLKGTDPERECFRMINQALVELKVVEVIPLLEETHAQLLLLIKNLSEDLAKRNQALQEYQKKHDIKLLPGNQMTVGSHQIVTA